MVAKMRASGATAVLKTEKLRDLVYVITGSGGNVAVLNGPDGKVMVDSGFGTSEKQFRTELASIGSEPLKLLINTHWHFDHTDGNEWLHKAGATIMAQENTRLRLSTPQDIAAYHLHFDPSPADALPQQTFLEQSKLYLNGESVALEHYRPAHTDSDIFIHFQHANVFHAGDTFFSGRYPMIDAVQRRFDRRHDRGRGSYSFDRRCLDQDHSRPRLDVGPPGPSGIPGHAGGGAIAGSKTQAAGQNAGWKSWPPNPPPTWTRSGEKATSRLTSS